MYTCMHVLLLHEMQELILDEFDSKVLNSIVRLGFRLVYFHFIFIALHWCNNSALISYLIIKAS